MQEVRQEELANLYAIRAGLSIVSEIADDIRIDEKRLAETQKEIADLEKEISDYGQEGERGKSGYLQEIESREERIRAYEKALEEAREIKNYVLRERKRVKTWTVLSCVAAFLLIAAFTFALFYNGGNLFVEKIAKIIAVGVGIFLLLSIFCALRVWSSWKKDEQYLPKKLAAERDSLRALQEEKKQLKEAQENQASAIAFYARADKKREEEGIRSREKAKKEKKRLVERMQYRQKQFTAVYKVLQKEYSSFLDEREWCNIDYILFNAQTDGVEDARDGLAQEAKKACAQIQMGFGAMATVVEQKTDMLDRAVRGATVAIEGVVIAENAELTAEYKSICKIASSLEALRRKRSVSSEELARDVDYLRSVERKVHSLM